MTTSCIEVSRSGAIATVTIRRAERRNAVNTEMMEDLERVCRAFSADEQSRVVVLRAEGEDFSVGADLAQPRFQAQEAPSLLMRRRTTELGSLLLRSIQEIHQPTICAVQGVATGAGACITSACDFRVGADTARMGYGEVKLGINLMWGAVPICVHLVGPARAKRMIMTGKLFDAATLLQWGFLDEVAPRAQLDDRASQWAEDLAALPPISVQMIKRSINMISGALDRAIMHMDTDQWLLTSTTRDFREAVEAFFEKRRPSFRGD